jgi:hypothetical protein
MIPVDLEAEIFEIELIRFGDVKDAEDRDDGLEIDGHEVWLQVCLV